MANEKRLIDFEKARKSVMEILAGKVTTPTAVKVSLAMQEAAVNAVEVVHGRWIEGLVIQTDISALYDYTCSECAIVGNRVSNYCPNCGAKMDGGNEDG